MSADHDPREDGGGRRSRANKVYDIELFCCGAGGWMVHHEPSLNSATCREPPDRCVTFNLLYCSGKGSLPRFSLLTMKFRPPFCILERTWKLIALPCDGFDWTW